jgi:hypothetical protein
MRKMLPILSVIGPLLTSVVAFGLFPTSVALGPVLITAFLLGWIGIGFGSISRLWLKVLMLVAYPFAMILAMFAAMVLCYGIPGL